MNYIIVLFSIVSMMFLSMITSCDGKEDDRPVIWKDGVAAHMVRGSPPQVWRAAGNRCPNKYEELSLLCSEGMWCTLIFRCK